MQVSGIITNTPTKAESVDLLPRRSVLILGVAVVGFTFQVMLLWKTVQTSDDMGSIRPLCIYLDFLSDLSS